MDTRNTLTDFDLCLSLSQQAINSQFQDAWEVWDESMGKARQLRLPDADGSPGEEGVDVEFGPLKAKLVVDDSALPMARIVLSARKGQVYFRDGGEPRALPLDGWKLAYLVELGYRRVGDLAILNGLDARSAEQIKSMMEATTLAERAFSIEYLGMRLSDRESLADAEAELKTPAAVPEAARRVALRALKEYLAKNVQDRLLLGAVAYPKYAQLPPSFDVTDFALKVTRHPSGQAQANSLDYLCVCGERDLPVGAALQEARERFPDSWIDPAILDGGSETVAGILAIRGEKLLKFLGERMAETLRASIPGVSTRHHGRSFVILFDQSTSQGDENFAIRAELFRESGFLLELQAEPGRDAASHDCVIKLRGQTYAGMRVETRANGLGRVTAIMPSALVSFDNRYTAGAIRPLLGEITLTPDSDGIRFSLKPAVHLEFQAPRFDQQKTSDGNELMEFVLKALQGKDIKDYLGDLNREFESSLHQATRAALDKLTIQLAGQLFTPPGTAQFTFKNPHFSSAGDLLFQVIYKGTRVAD